MLVADVLIDIQAKGLSQTYDYLLPPDASADALGCAVLVPFGHRQEVGFVLGVREAAEAEGLKRIERILTEPLLAPSAIECARFVSERYLAPLASCVRLFVPQGAVPRLKRGPDGKRILEEAQVREVTERWISRGPAFAGYEPRTNAYKQARLIELIAETDVSVSELTLLLGDVSQTIRTLADKGVITVDARRRLRSDGGSEPGALDRTSETVELTEGQKRALASIDEAMDAACGRVVLIDGVTGSGKTEVYLRAIERTLASGRGSIVLVPEIALTPQMVSRFRARFGSAVALLHSKMSQGERFDQFEVIRSGRAKVVIGPRSALFAPLPDAGLVIIDEEHESTYKQESSPRYLARDVAIRMMQQSGGTVVLGSATPSIESLYAANTSPDWSLCEMHERANGKSLPRIEVIDMTAEFRDGEKSIFSRPLKQAITEELAHGRKVVLLLNQRGFARFLLCRDCGFVPECVNCSTSLTFHESDNALVCHHCGYAVSAPARCPSCSSPYLKRFGIGTERAEAELRSFLDAEACIAPALAGARGTASIPIIRMDADTTSAKGSHKRLLEEFASSEGAVLLGTQMIAKGLDFDDVTLVGVINADTQLHLPDFRAAERTFDLIEQVAGRAGRAELPGRVLVQTYEADSLAIEAAAAYDRDLFLRAELPKRRALRYPPFVRMANLLVWGPDEQQVIARARSIHRLACQLLDAQSHPGFEVSAPTSCAFERIRNSFRWHIVVKCPRDADLSSALRPLAERIKATPGISTAIDIDPLDLL